MRTLIVLCCSLGLAGAAPSTAGASGNTGPSKAANVQVGAPFTGVWQGTPYDHGSYPNHWWRLPTILRPGDTIQIAVDNRLSRLDTNFCLIPPVDDFGANNALSQYCPEFGGSSVGDGEQNRLQMTYEGPSGQAYLVAWSDDYCCLDPGETVESGYGQYTVAIERITTLVNIGMAVPPALPSSFSLAAAVVYGDNTPAADGTPAFLQWRPVTVKGADPLPFTNVVAATSAGGVVTFNGTMPAAAEGQKVQLRACVAQPGGTEVRCGASGRTVIAESPCSRALQSQLVLARVVHRLARHVRRHRPGPAKLRLKRKLKAKRHRLAQASRNVKLTCG
jgi:hypothetical protein